METQLGKTSKLNLIYFMISYFISNLASGVMYDTYVNYMHEVARPIATSFWSFYGYATFISAAFMLLIPKIGYKPLLILCNFSNIIAFVIVSFTTNTMILGFSTLISLTGLQLHLGILAPFISVNTDRLEDGGIKWFTRSYYIGYIGYFLATYLGGVAVVAVFSKLMNLHFGQAQELTRYMEKLSGDAYIQFLNSNRYVMLALALISALGIIPILLMQEVNEQRSENEKESWTNKFRQSLKVLGNKDARIYLVYWSLISFAMGLFASYYTVYLNRNLHIDKATSSLVVSISYMAIVVFMLFTPVVVKKLGPVNTIAAAVIFSVPFMMVIGFGDRFGRYVVPVVGVALFIRAGLANLSSPAESSLSMSLVPKELRPAYAAVINFVAGIISIISGEFTGRVLFITQEGYRYAYYIASVIYIAAGLVVFIGLRKHNRENNNE